MSSKSDERARLIFEWHFSVGVLRFNVFDLPREGYLHRGGKEIACVHIRAALMYK